MNTWATYKTKTAPLGRTVLLLGNQLDQVIGDCQYNARANVKPLKPEGATALKASGCPGPVN